MKGVQYAAVLAPTQNRPRWREKKLKEQQHNSAVRNALRTAERDCYVNICHHTLLPVPVAVRVPKPTPKAYSDFKA